MVRQILVVAWDDTSLSGDDTEWMVVAKEALRLSVGRIGCIALGCRVTKVGVRLVIECNNQHDPGELIEWVRAAARYAITRYLGYGPQWDAPYRFAWISGAAVAEEITACLTIK
ncbi:MAG: hypothetical protein NT020_06250 [Chloroflexales bacterium]|nr:hypothetical protein [Chloroflexales bacterium]